MPAPATTDEFLELVRKSSLVDNNRLAATLQVLRAEKSFPAEPAKAAALLVRDALLTHFQVEQILQGKWRRFMIDQNKVLERLGSGCAGSVYLCEDTRSHRLVAVKVLPTTRNADSVSVARFRREFQILAHLYHPNTLRAHAFGLDDSLHYIGMEYVDGSSFEQIVEKCGPMDVSRVAHYLRQAALGLQHIYERGVVHRDIKPSDILVDRSGTVKIIDMGLARIISDGTDLPTGRYCGDLLGTPDYMAPEQAVEPCSVDIRADLYSLGATFYFCLVGSPPFPEGTIAQKVLWHRKREPQPIQRLRPEVPMSKRLAALIEQMMAKDVAQRPQAPQEVADALAPYTKEFIGPPPEAEMPIMCTAVRAIPAW